MIELTRYDDSKSGTHGQIQIMGKTFESMEQADRNNKPFESCIPLGEYDLVPFTSPKYGQCFIMVNEDLNVYAFEDSPGRPDDGRFLCLFTHWGNYPRNYVGCVGAGERWIKDQDMITNTRKSSRKVNNLVDLDGSYRLLIKHHWG